MKRRQALLGLATAIVSSLAGCNLGEDATEPTPDDTPTPTPDDTHPTQSLTVVNEVNASREFKVELVPFDDQETVAAGGVNESSIDANSAVTLETHVEPGSYIAQMHPNGSQRTLNRAWDIEDGSTATFTIRGTGEDEWHPDE